MNNMNTTTDRALELGRRIYQRSRRTSCSCPRANTTFEVTGMERARFEGSAKLPPCSMAKLTLKIFGGAQGRHHRHPPPVPPHQDAGPAGRFLREHRPVQAAARPSAPAGTRSSGAKGCCKLGIREYTKQSGPHAGETGQSNEVIRFLPPPEAEGRARSGLDAGGILMGEKQALRPYQAAGP